MSFQSLIVGCIHAFFGINLIGLQVACFIMQAYYYQNGLLFEGRFAPGAWLGGFILITGIMGIVHGCIYGGDGSKSGRIRVLRNWIIAFNILVAVLSVIMMGLAIGFRMLDPEGFMFTDCEYPFVPWIYYYAPHCEVKHKVTIMGSTMMAVACFEAVFGLAGAIVVRKADDEFIRRG
ncbi:hypothetical protein BV898_11325 [Hypsibius exemplaris]|uniref:Uncharacterized protein n=1 Tax=Hypsibius exemplaris TaxID=2072580 RepID=A0A1W0WH80_HYPEX|nr:hypothetical protein BV898_11325 [Hypsibius exemplaris]